LNAERAISSQHRKNNIDDDDENLDDDARDDDLFGALENAFHSDDDDDDATTHADAVVAANQRAFQAAMAASAPAPGGVLPGARVVSGVLSVEELEARMLAGQSSGGGGGAQQPPSQQQPDQQQQLLLQQQQQALLLRQQQYMAQQQYMMHMAQQQQAWRAMQFHQQQQALQQMQAANVVMAQQQAQQQVPSSPQQQQQQPPHHQQQQPLAPQSPLLPTPESPSGKVPPSPGTQQQRDVARQGISFMQDPSYPFYRRITRNGQYMSADEMDKIVCIQAAGLFSSRLSIDDYYYQQRLKGDAQHAAKLQEYAGRLRSWQAQVAKKENAVANAASASPAKPDAALGSLSVKSVRAPRVLLEFATNDVAASGDESADAAAAAEQPLDELQLARRARTRLIVIEKSLDDVIGVECIDEELYELEQAGADESALEAKRTAMCDDMLKRLDVFVLPYGSNTKLTRSEVQRADAFFLGIVRERKGTKLLARALDVLSLKHAVRVLLFYVRNLLPLATEADCLTSGSQRDPSVAAVFRHLVGIIGACERQQVVIAMQTLISFHASQHDVRAVLAREGGAAVVTALLSRAHQLLLNVDTEDPLATHWREIFKYFSTRALGVLGRMARAVTAQPAGSAENPDDIDEGEEDLRFDALTPLRFWSLSVSIALHATPDSKATIREELSDVFRTQPMTQELGVVLQLLAQQVQL
jgi:hypothetical protein